MRYIEDLDYWLDGANTVPNRFASGGRTDNNLIANILRQHGVEFRQTSGYRGPNSKVGKAGKHSAHARRLHDGSPAAIDIVPAAGSSWDRLFAQMNTPEVRKALADGGFDILNETSASMMKRTGATGPHLHIGQGIRGASGAGQMFGGGSFGGGGADPVAARRGSAAAGNAAVSLFQPSPSGEFISLTSPQQAAPAFTPWWAAGSQADSVSAEDSAQPLAIAPIQALLPDVSMFALGWDPVNGRTQPAAPSSFPKLFAEGGGLLTDEDLVGTGWYWGTPSGIHFTDPLYQSTLNANGTFKDERYLFDENGALVPKSAALSYADNRTRLGDVIYSRNKRDIAAAKAARHLFGENTDAAYNSIVQNIARSGGDVLPNEYINRLDTLAQHSSYPYVNASNGAVEQGKSLSGTMPDGRLRALYRKKPWNPWRHEMVIEPGPRFIDDYLSEFTHHYQYNNKELDFLGDPGLLIGENARKALPKKAYDTEAYSNPKYNEWKAHHMIQPLMLDYLTRSNATYDDFLQSLKQKAQENRAADYVPPYPVKHPYWYIPINPPVADIHSSSSS